MLEMMDKLRALGRPFTDAGEVEEYLRDETGNKNRNQRMKLELQFAQEKVLRQTRPCASNISFALFR